MTDALLAVTVPLVSTVPLTTQPIEMLLMVALAEIVPLLLVLMSMLVLPYDAPLSRKRIVYRSAQPNHVLTTHSDSSTIFPVGSMEPISILAMYPSAYSSSAPSPSLLSPR